MLSQFCIIQTGLEGNPPHRQIKPGKGSNASLAPAKKKDCVFPWAPFFEQKLLTALFDLHSHLDLLYSGLICQDTN